MGMFGKKNKESKELTNYYNEVMRIRLELEENKVGSKAELDLYDQEIVEKIHHITIFVFIFIKELNESFVYSNSAVKKFILDDYPWVDKANIDKYIEIGLKRYRKK